MLRAIGVPAISGFLAASCLVVGCTDTSSSLTVVAVPTLLTVDPRLFLGGVRCGAPDLVSYVSAVIDVTMISSPIVAASTPPTAVSTPTTCPTPTSFGSPPVVVGDLYIAQVDGYDRPACDVAGCIKPSAPGSRQMVDSATGAPVAPRFRWQCGEPSNTPADASGDGSSGSALRAPVRALYSTEVFFQGCEPLTEVPSADASAPDACGPAGCDGSADASASDGGVSGEASTSAEGGDASDQDGGETTPEPPDASDSGG
jgi:hypothetical protein